MLDVSSMDMLCTSFAMLANVGPRSSSGSLANPPSASRKVLIAAPTRARRMHIFCSKPFVRTKPSITGMPKPCPQLCLSSIVSTPSICVCNVASRFRSSFNVFWKSCSAHDKFRGPTTTAKTTPASFEELRIKGSQLRSEGVKVNSLIPLR